MSEARRMMTYDANKKSALVAYLLSWLLGPLGIHRFYLGRTASAVGMLCLTIMGALLLILSVGVADAATAMGAAGVIAIIAAPTVITVAIWLFVDLFLFLEWSEVTTTI
jgi:TM2 domain-containing membrane protein YozV